ncbi:hypothetical protein H5410_021629 [Solanum commersonii]|uniref:Uncharacterized protein n=1 Tax=Solanum commersonii TaxID=4109 RepID=A0A9J5ZFU3_SOLCO|nr:hypothetical protein H5410_021629 [Solanum commersonii]
METGFWDVIGIWARLDYLVHAFDTNHSASLVEIANQLGDPPFGRFHRYLALSFSIYCFAELLGDTLTAPFHHRFDPFFQGLTHWNKSKTQVQQFKKDVSSSATQDSIMDAHNKTQFTYAKIHCALKDSSCDSPLSKNLMFTILGSNASSSSTIVFKCPHTKNDSIFTHNELARIFQSAFVSTHSRSLRSFKACNRAEYKGMII